MAGAAWHKVGTIASRRLKAQGVISFGRVARTWSQGNITSGTDIERTMQTAPGVYGNWDRFGRTLQQKWFRGTTTHDQVDYTYDYAGNRLTRDIPSTLYVGNDLDQKYTYDGLQRFTSMDQGTYNPGTGAIESPNYAEVDLPDAIGNLWLHRRGPQAMNWSLVQTRNHNSVNELVSIQTQIGTAWADPAHDAAGNMTTISKPLAPSSSYTATYDAWNRLVRLESPMTYIQTNEYDGLNQRIQKNIAAGYTIDYYYNDQWQVIVEAKNGVAEAIYAWHHYYIDALAVRFRATDQHYFLHDANFNVTAAYDVNPSSGTYRQVVERYRYTPYGQAIILDANFAVGAANGTISDIDNVYLYTGRERDPETGLQLNRNRYYHPGLGRWINRDPLEYLDSLNSYLYVGGSPLNYVDPDGTAPPVAIAVGAAAAIRIAWGLAVRLMRTVKNIRCKKPELHPPHHAFRMPRWGWPPYKTCYMKHAQVNCYLKGCKKSGRAIRVPYGPCYKFKHGQGGVTH